MLVQFPDIHQNLKPLHSERHCRSFLFLLSERQGDSHLDRGQRGADELFSASVPTIRPLRSVFASQVPAIHHLDYPASHRVHHPQKFWSSPSLSPPAPVPKLQFLRHLQQACPSNPSRYAVAQLRYRYLGG